MSGLFGKQTQSTTPTRLNGIAINQSVYGNAIPLLYGTSRIPLTLIDYVDFKAIPQSQSSGGKGGGGQTTSGYTYTASIVGLLCEGPVSAITAVYNDQAQTTLTDPAINLILFDGNPTQVPWTYWIQNHPDHALTYGQTAYVAGANFQLGSSGGLPNLSFEVKSVLNWNGLDAEPSQIIVDYCTNASHGIGFPYLADLGGPNSYQSYCVAMNFLISPQETTQRQAQSFLSDILQATNSNAVFTAGVGLRIVPYADQPVSSGFFSYTPNLTPVYAFTDADYIFEDGQAPVQVTITAANETYNVWTVEYLNRANQYNVDTQTFRDEQDISINGVRVAPTVSLHAITVAATALNVATLLCFRNLYVRSQFVFKVRADFSLLEPMDYVAITDSSQGIVDKLVRIIECDDDENDVFTITAEEVEVGPASAPLYDTELAQGYAANTAADPGAVSAPYILTAPPTVFTQHGDGYQQWIAVNGASGLWGGADVYASLDNDTYSLVGVKSNPSRYGTLATDLPVGSDPDTANNLVVSFLGAQTVELASATRAAADGLQTLCVVDGELISYQTATPLGNNSYSLSYLRRGCYGTPIGDHPSGSSFAVLDETIFRMPFDPGLSGQPVWFKFVSYNIYGKAFQDISQVPAYQSFFEAQAGGQLLAPGATPLIARGVLNRGSQIFKTAGVNAWDSDCYSIDAFTAGCYLTFRPMQTTAEFMIGLNADPLTDESFDTIDYAWRCAADGSALIYENGALVFSTGFYTTNTIFRIQWDGKYITYTRDGVIWRTEPRSGNAAPLYFDSSFFTVKGGADNVSFGPLNAANSSPYVARNGCVASGEKFSKSPSANTAWDADIYSLEGYPTCTLSFKPNAIAGINVMMGLGTKPGQDSNFTSIDYAWYLGSNPSAGWFIYENGINTGIFVTGGARLTDRAAISYDGTTIKYTVNNIIWRTVTKPGLRLFLDSSFLEPGSGVNSVQFGPDASLQYSDTSQIGANAATLVYQAGSNVTGGFATASAAGHNAFALLTIPDPPPYDCTAIVTLTGNLHYATPSGVFIEVSYGDNGTGLSAGTPTYGTTQIPLTSTATPYALQFQFAHSAANTGTPGDYAYAGWSVYKTASGAITVNVDYYTVQVEYVLK